MLTEIGDIEHVPAYVERSRRATSGSRASATGLQELRPRARIIKKTADEVFEVTGKNPCSTSPSSSKRVALSDPYFTDRRLYPNVDFYSGLIYQAMGIPGWIFHRAVRHPRTAGWLSHYLELLDQDSRIYRPRQLYVGHPVGMAADRRR